MPTKSELLKKAKDTFPAHWTLLCEAGENPAQLVLAEVLSVVFTPDPQGGDLALPSISLEMRAEGYLAFTMTGFLWESNWIFKQSPTAKFRTFAKYFADYLVNDILRHQGLTWQDWLGLPG